MGPYRFPHRNGAGPLFLLLDAMARHLAPYADTAGRPAWVDFVFDFQAAKQEAAVSAQKEGLEDSTLVRKATRQVQSTFRRSERALGVRSDRMLDSGNLLLAGQSLLLYRESLAEITPIAASRRLAYQLAAEFYENDGAVESSGGSAFDRAYEQVDALTGVLSDPGRDLAAMDSLLAGPVSFSTSMRSGRLPAIFRMPGRGRLSLR